LCSLRHALERGQRIEEVEVDSMLIEGSRVTEQGEETFQTLGFAVAAGGIGQRFFEKLHEAGVHTGSTIVSVITKTVASYPVAMSPLRRMPGMPRLLRQYARDMFKPTQARLLMDGQALPYTQCTGIHVASMSINLAGVLKFFSQADVPGQLHAIVGEPSPLRIIMNIPRMHFGMQMKGERVYDGPCRELTMEAIGDEPLAPVIDGEFYEGVRRLAFTVGPRVRIPKVVGRVAPN
jgi:hypothetical protein